MELYNRVAEYVHKHDLIDPDETLVVGVSGGADSLCLLDVLSKWGLDLIVAHLDHGLRPESASDASYVQEIANRYGHTFEHERVELNPELSGSLEQAARLARYGFLVEVARRYDIAKIAVGHTFDDQVETILMHFLRGAGPAGLRGMLPETNLADWVAVPQAEGRSVIRPLLAIRHAEAAEYCESVGLAPRFDHSNLDMTFFRNRIRHELLPALEEYNPGVRDVIYRLGEVMRSEVEFVQSQVDMHWPDVTIPLGKDALLLKRAALLDLALALQRNIIRRAILELRPAVRDLGFDQIERALSYMLAADRPASQPIIEDLLVLDYEDDVIIAPAGVKPLLPDCPQIEETAVLSQPFPDRIQLADGWYISFSESREMNVEIAKSGRFDALDVAVDRSKLGDRLTIRTREPGDRLQPLGMQGSMKVSDLMINEKVPYLAREHWPVLLSDHKVVWIPGLQLGHPFRITEATQDTLRMRVVPGDAFGDGV